MEAVLNHSQDSHAAVLPGRKTGNDGDHQDMSSIPNTQSCPEIDLSTGRQESLQEGTQALDEQ